MEALSSVDISLFEGFRLDRPNSRDGLAEAISLFEHALAVDPGSSEARAGWRSRS
jgi:hypothetical protein